MVGPRFGFEIWFTGRGLLLCALACCCSADKDLHSGWDRGGMKLSHQSRLLLGTAGRWGRQGGRDLRRGGGKELGRSIRGDTKRADRGEEEGEGAEQRTYRPAQRARRSPLQHAELETTLSGDLRPYPPLSPPLSLPPFLLWD